MRTYEEWLRGRGFSKNTVRSRMTFYRARDAEWGTWDLPALVIAGWLSRYDGWTRVTYHNHLTSIYAWLLEVGIVASSPLVSIKRPPLPRPRPRPLTESDLRRALMAATPRVRAFLLLGYLGGLRACEIAKLHGRDVDAQSITILGKGGSSDSVPTHPLLWELARSMPRDGYWFPPLTRKTAEHIDAGTVSYHVGRLFKSLGIRGATHRCRHTYGTVLLRSGANLRVVQELMRHKSLATTALYLGVDDDERHAAIRSLAA